MPRNTDNRQEHITSPFYLVKDIGDLLLCFQVIYYETSTANKIQI